MNTTTKAQRTNKRQAAIWEKAKSLATANAEAPLGRCPKCKQPLRYYDGCLGYEAARCDACNFERDLNAKANGNPVEGEFAADKTAITPGSDNERLAIAIWGENWQQVAPGMQDKTAHTPGPWKVMADPSYEPGLHPLHHHRYVTTDDMGVDERNGLKDFDGQGSIICALRDQERQAQDARLLAAAPDLLQALKALTQAIDDHGVEAKVEPDVFDTYVLAADRVIAKAEGNS